MSTTTPAAGSTPAASTLAAAPTRDEDRTIGQLVVKATDDVRGLIDDHVALAKAEITQGVKVMGMGAGLLAGAGVAAVFGLIFLLHGLAQVIAIWLPVWAGYLIVTLVLFVVAAILALVGKNALDKASPKPEKAVASAQETIAMIKP